MYCAVQGHYYVVKKLHVANFIIKSQPTLIPNLFEGTVYRVYLKYVC
jgi:hypothetical protein